MQKSAFGLLSAIVLALPAMAAEDHWGFWSYLWQPVGDEPHMYNDAANYEDSHKPVSFEGVCFKSGGTVKIPAATAESPYTDGAGLFPHIGDFARGDTLTIDGAGTYWLKKYDTAEHAYANGNSLIAMNGGNVFSFEGRNLTAQGNGAAEFLATNMVLKFTRAAAEDPEGSTVTLEQGYWNFYDPEGTAYNGIGLKLFSGGGSNRVIYEEGTQTRIYSYDFRGNGPDDLFWIKGGHHESFADFPLKSYANNNPGRMRISGGTFDQRGGWFIISRPDMNPSDTTKVQAYLTIDGTGTFAHTNNNTTYVGWSRYASYGGNGSTGYLDLGDYGSAYVCGLQVGARDGSIGYLTMSGNSYLSQIASGYTTYLGKEKDSIGIFTMTNNARAVLGQLRIGAEDSNQSRPHAYGELNLAGNAWLSVSSGVYAGRSVNSTGIVDIAEHAFMTTLGTNIQLADGGTNGYARLSVSGEGGLEHGNIYIANNPGTDADLIFSGSATNRIWNDNNNYILFVGKTTNSVGRAYFKDNSRTTFGQVRIAADDNNRAHDTAKGEMYIMDNASVSVKNELYLGRAWNTEALLDISGGLLDMNNSQFKAGNNSNALGRVQMTGGKLLTSNNIRFGEQPYSIGELDMTGGELQMTGGELFFNNADNSTGTYYIGGDACLNLTNCNCIYPSIGNNTETELVIGGNAQVWGARFWFANTGTVSGWRKPTVTVKDNAYLQWRGDHMALSNNSTNRLHVTDNATLDLTGGIQMGWRNDATTYSEVVFDGNMKLKGNGSIDVGSGSNASIARAYFRSGTSTAPGSNNNWGNININGLNSYVEVSGGDFQRQDLLVYQASGYENWTNTFRMVGGKLRMHSWTVLGNNGVSGRVEIDGGEFSTREIDIGFENMNADQLSVMRVTGGKVTVVNDNPTDDAWLQLGNNTGRTCHGRLEQVGGEICTHTIRGYHSSAGSSEAFFDGGKVTHSVKVHGTYGIIQDIDSAVVGATGLTIDSNGFNSYIKQAFTDADDGSGGTVDGKVTKTGEGSLDVRLNSDHAVTVVEQGTLSFSNGADHFGRKLVLAAGASVKVEEGTPIRVEEVETLGTCYVDVDFISGNGSYQIFDSSTIDPSQMTGLRLRVSDPYKSYTWGADGKLTIADRTFTDAEWTGETSSAWNAAGNWDPATVPGAGSRALFGAVQNRSVTVASGDETDIAEFTASGYTVSGSDALKVNSAVVNDSEETVTFSAPVEFGAAVAIDGTAGGETVFSGGVAGNGTAVAKTGSSKASIGGTGEDFTGSWLASGGTLEFTRSGALGTFGELEVGLATVDYSAGNNGTAAGKLVVNTGVAKRGAIVDVSSAGTLTFSDVRLDSGSFVKKGAGTLKFDLGAGQFNFGDTSDRWDNPDIDIAFEASGDSPASTDMFNNFSVVEGRMVIEGDGSNVTKVVHRNGLAVGERYAGKVAEAELVLKNVYFDNFVDAYFSIGRVARSTTFNEPSVQVLDGTYLHTHKIVVGWGSAVDTLSTLAVTNSVVYCNDHIRLAENDNSTAKVRVGPGGKIRARNNIDIRGGLDVLVEGEGAEMTAENNNGHDNRWTWDGILRFEDWRGEGTMAFKNGGTLSLASRIHCFNKYTDGSAARPGVQLVFDGGTLKLGSNGTSIMWKPQYQGVKTEGAGMTLSVAEGAVSTWTIPIRGDGGLVKTGAGELNFAGVKDCTDYRNVNSVFEFDFTDTDMLNGWYEGATEVREGTLTLAAGSITNTTDVTVGEAGTLNLGGNSFEFPSVAGAGVISNGTLTAKILVAVNGNTDEGTTPVFSGVTLPANQRFDLSFTEGELEYNQAYTLSMGGFAADGMAGWTAWVDGKRKRAEFSVDGSGHTVITVRHDHGTMLFIR